MAWSSLWVRRECARRLDGDLHEQVDLTRQHRIDLDEVLLRDAVAVVAVQLELAAVAAEQLAQERVVVGRLLQEALVDHVADVGAGQVHAQAGREAVLQLARWLPVSAASSSFCWPVAKSHTLPRSCCPSSETKDWSLSMRSSSWWTYWLTSSTTMNSALPGSRGSEHRLDGLDHLLRR
jgi:hypothetical protein